MYENQLDCLDRETSIVGRLPRAGHSPATEAGSGMRPGSRSNGTVFPYVPDTEIRIVPFVNLGIGKTGLVARLDPLGVLQAEIVTPDGQVPRTGGHDHLPLPAESPRRYMEIGINRNRDLLRIGKRNIARWRVEALPYDGLMGCYVRHCVPLSLVWLKLH